MIGADYILAGDEFFYTHPQSGTLIVGSLARSSFPGHDGSLSSRISPAMRTPAARERPFVSPPAVAPLPDAAAAAGSHLWVG